MNFKVLKNNKIILKNNRKHKDTNIKTICFDWKEINFHSFVYKALNIFKASYKTVFTAKRENKPLIFDI